MARKRKPGAKPGAPIGSEEWRRRVSEGTRWALAKRRQLAQVAPSELAELERTGSVSDSLRPYAAQAIEEADAFAHGLGGIDAISAQRLALIQDASRVGLVLRAVVARFLQGEGDPELASKVGSLASTRRSLLTALGLERLEKEVDLTDYLERKATEDRSSETNAAASDSQVGDVGEVAAEVNHR